MDTSYFFRIKLSYKGYDDQGGIVPVKEEHLVMAVNYGEAEAVAHALYEEVDSFGDEWSYEIIRTKIEDIDFNEALEVDSTLVKGLVPYYFSEDEDSETGLYAVSVIYSNIDEKTGKEKKSNGTIYVPASTSNDAIKNTAEFFRKVGETRDYVIRNVKYDKAQSILVTPEQHKYNTELL